MSKTALYLVLAGAGVAGVIAVTMNRAPDAPDAPAPQPAPLAVAPQAPATPTATGPDKPLVAADPATTAVAADPGVQPTPTTVAPAPGAAPLVSSDAPQPGVTPVVPAPAAAPLDAAEAPLPGAAPSEQATAPRPAVAAPGDTALAPSPGDTPIPGVAGETPVETASAPRPGVAPPDPGTAPKPAPSAPAETATAPAPDEGAPAGTLARTAPAESAPAETVAAAAPPEPGAEPGLADMALLPLFEPGQGAVVPELLFDGDATLIRPRFDVVRAETDGFSLVAGGGEPGALLEILVNGDLAETVTIGGDGKFSVFLELSAAEASVISLRMTKDDTVVVSDDEIIVAPAQVAAAEIRPAPRPGGTGPATPLLETQAGAEPAPAPGAATGGEGAPASGTLTAGEGAPGSSVDVAAAPGLIPAPRAPDVSPARPAATVDGPNVTSGSPDPSAAPVPDGVARAVPLPQTGDAPGPLAAPGATGDPDGAAVPALPDNGGAPVVTAAPATVTGSVPAGDAPASVTNPEVPLVTARAPGAPAQPESALATDARTPAGDPVITARAEPLAGAVPAEPRAPAVLLSTPRGVEALSTDPIAPGDVALDAISYNDAGDVLLSGRGDTSAFVRIYLDNAPITTSRIREDGRWRVDLPEVDTGTYTLRIDQIDARGQVLARVESPFLRESAAVLERAVTQGGGIATVTIQPGNTLWGISRQRYGDGMQFVRIFEANRERIRDPDLIYPGQIFDLPSGPTD
ncbi:LysM peptidoglycan-binding domain-containing protein [Maliponia aquimaris]|uniref:LysM domain/BON superfamily protein n=1 Tax=Maliponia aquimaris TaxID=1673631 RepID=A0A238K2T9_9RHOB|nr:LysM peptidoglycan-binding domain-containing protein [Maliponia aquimaris]SMX36777.1 LysM domain/BON superfamily protein [Maliponia aquimaris]